MKKILFAAAVLFAICSCVKKEYDFPSGMPQDRTPVSSMKLSMPGDYQFPAGAKAQGWKIVDGGKAFDFTAVAGGNPAEFTLSEGVEPVEQIAYVIYPNIIVDSLWRGEFFFSIPQTQEAVEEGFEDDLWISAAHKAKDETVLTPVVGRLEFKINQADIFACEISSKDGNALSGPVEMDMFENISVKKVANSAGEVKVYGDLQSGKIYNAVVMADEYTSLDVRLINNFGTSVWEKTIDVFAKLENGGCINLGEFGNPDISSLALSMTSSEFEGYTLKKVTVYSENEKRLFGGNVNETFTSGQPVTARLFGVEPVDYTGSKLWFELVMEDASGNGVTIPLKEDGFAIAKGTEVPHNLGEISSSRNAAPWFCLENDKRLMAGEGYAYGEANTFLIQCKSSCYTGTVIEDPTIPESVTIDYRLRGTLFGGPKPDDVTFEWLMGYGYNDSTPKWGKYTMDRTNIYNCDKYSFTVDAANYKVTVKNEGAHAGSPILLMKKDGKVIWAWTFWNIAADGTHLEAVDFGGVKIANMDIGYCSNQISKIIPKLKFIRSSCNYYQWGRPMPVFSQNGAGISLGETDTRNAGNPRIPVHDSGAITVGEALAHPGTVIQNPYVKGKVNSLLNDWISGGVVYNTNLWGGSTVDEAGIKSIYDPCPKGWRVPDAKTYLAVVPEPVKGYSTETYPAEASEGYQGVYVSGVLFPTNGLLNPQTDDEGFVSQLAFSPKSNSTAADASRFWTNTYYGGTSSNQCYVFRTDYQFKKLDGTANPDRTVGVDYSVVGTALPVRCQKDDDNR